MGTFSPHSGYGNSEKFTQIILTGTDGSTLPPANFSRQCAFVVIRCTDVSNVAAGTDTLSLKISITDVDELLELEDENGETKFTLDELFNR